MKKLLLGLMLLSSTVFAAELPKELSMLTDVGKVAITVKDCPLKNKYGFSLEAYATEKKGNETITHPACWMKQGDIVYIWFYNESPSVVASYKDYYFKPEISL
jgi:hypothetical protein